MNDLSAVKHFDRLSLDEKIRRERFMELTVTREFCANHVIYLAEQVSEAERMLNRHDSPLENALIRLRQGLKELADADKALKVWRGEKK